MFGICVAGALWESHWLSSCSADICAHQARSEVAVLVEGWACAQADLARATSSFDILVVRGIRHVILGKGSVGHGQLRLILTPTLQDHCVWYPDAQQVSCGQLLARIACVGLRACMLNVHSLKLHLPHANAPCLVVTVSMMVPRSVRACCMWNHSIINQWSISLSSLHLSLQWLVDFENLGVCKLGPAIHSKQRLLCPRT